ncbi:hypothetical protein ACIBKX_32865 [Streptomyces sp. NPDC050658]|uniref:hypothetical protein n=1 Tax=unclassified Streptomyces TaxID=2593676 RepID=UPI00341CF3AA
MANELLQRVIDEAGCTYAELAREVRTVAGEMGNTRLRTNASAVAHWVAGTRPIRATAHCLAEALSRKVGRPLTLEHIGLDQEGEPALEAGSITDVVGSLVRLGKADIDRHPSVTAAPYAVNAALPVGWGESTVTVAAQNRILSIPEPGNGQRDHIEAIRTTTETFADLGRQYDGQHARSAVVQYLVSEAAPLCRAGLLGEQQRERALTATASLTALAGVKACDGGEQGLAQQYFLRALELTEAANDDRHAGFALSMLAHHGLEAGRPEHTLTLTSASLERANGGLDPATESMLRATHARALAMAGRHQESLAEAARSTELGAEADQDEMPYWAALWGPTAACASSQLAKAAMHRGDLRTAEQLFAQTVVQWRDAAYPATLARVNVGFIQCRQGNLEQACATWHQVLDSAATIRSPRLVGYVVSMRKALGPFSRRGGRAAQELDERAAMWLKRCHLQPD